MKNVAVVFWSGTGNTEAMAEAVAKGARAAGASASVIPVGSFDASQIAKFDAFAFGCPAMGSEALEDSEFRRFREAIRDKATGELIGGAVRRRILADVDDDAVAACQALGAALA